MTIYLCVLCYIFLSISLFLSFSISLISFLNVNPSIRSLYLKPYNDSIKIYQNFTKQKKKVLQSRNVFSRNKLIGNFKLDVATVWNQKGKKYLRK